MTYVSTLKASKLLLVSPDTILKWIEEGKLKARMTAEKRYLISRESVLKLLLEEEHLIAEVANGTRPAVPCWEYNADDGAIKNECPSCLIFEHRQIRCYRVAEFLRKNGLGATCCPIDCKDCSYYLFSAQTQNFQNSSVSPGAKALRDSRTNQRD